MLVTFVLTVGGIGECPSLCVPPAYTVSFVGDEDLEDGAGLGDKAAAATAFESCWNHRSRARLLTASTSFDASGTGILCSEHVDP